MHFFLLLLYFTEVVYGRDTFENVPVVFEHLVDSKMMTIVGEDSYDPNVLDAASVILSYTRHTPQASTTAPTFRVTITTKVTEISNRLYVKRLKGQKHYSGLRVTVRAGVFTPHTL